MSDQVGFVREDFITFGAAMVRFEGVALGMLLLTSLHSNLGLRKSNANQRNVLDRGDFFLSSDEGIGSKESNRFGSIKSRQMSISRVLSFSISS